MKYPVVLLSLCISCLAVADVCKCQTKINDSVVLSIENLLEKEMHLHYYVRVFDVDQSVNKPSVSGGRIKDPYGMLKGCFIFIAEALPDSNLNKAKGFVGIWKGESVIWKSNPLTEELSSLGGRVVAVDELNKDGKDEIVISQNELPGAAMANYLWIFVWDGKVGRQATELDERGESRLAFIGKYKFTDLDGDGILEVQGEWYRDEKSDKTGNIVYSWNGSSYGQWGKNSNFFHGDGRK